MPEIDYPSFPAFKIWKTESMYSARKNDKILARVDELVQDYHDFFNVCLKLYTLVDLFFTTDYWLKVCDSAPGKFEGIEVAKIAKPGVYKLYKVIVKELCAATNTTPNTLCFWLDQSYGKGLVEHGIDCDLATEKQGKLVYLTRDQVHEWKINFKDGKAYRKGTFDALSALDTSAMRLPVFHAGWGGYIMSIGRDFFTSPNHKAGEFFHSSYLAGGVVMCAGEIKITAGKIEAISSASGHYQPSEAHLAHAVEALAMHGVDIADVKVYNHDHSAFKMGNVVITDRMKGLIGKPADSFGAADRKAFHNNDVKTQLAGKLRPLQERLSAMPAKCYEEKRANWVNHKTTPTRGCQNNRCGQCAEVRSYAQQCGLVKSQVGSALAADNAALVAWRALEAEITGINQRATARLQ